MKNGNESGGTFPPFRRRAEVIAAALHQKDERRRDRVLAMSKKRRRFLLTGFFARTGISFAPARWPRENREKMQLAHKEAAAVEKNSRDHEAETHRTMSSTPAQ